MSMPASKLSVWKLPGIGYQTVQVQDNLTAPFYTFLVSGFV